jgi:hypothetical protein
MLLFSFATFTAQDKNNVSSKIESTEVEGTFQIKAIASNKSPIHQSLSYQILAVKEGNTGNLSSSQQSGKFTLQPKESKQLSQMSLNLDKNDGLKVFLFIRDENNKTVSKDSLIYNVSKKIESAATASNFSEADIQLHGLTIDETKTRAGSTFYSKLNNYILLNDIKLDFILKVTELPARGTNTQIQVTANDSNIYAFIPKPEDDFLDSAVADTIASIEIYNKDQNVEDKGFIY